MDALQAVGEPARRRVVELLAMGERSAGDLARDLESELGLSQPAVSRHLRILRESGLVRSEVRGQSRVYSLDGVAVAGLADWADGIRAFWSQRLDALETELFRGTHRRSVHTESEAGREGVS